MPLELLTMLELDGYGRFSSDGQKDGTSEQRQRDGCASAAKKLGARLHMLPF